MNAEIVATGEEIRTGALIDSNSAHIAERLTNNGVAVIRHTSVGDDLENLRTVFSEIGNRADVAVVTGGLGPTADDLTAEAAAKAAGVG
ncbi:MAG: damage-inducible protein CinA, partial [Deltaproteobacteria bacterium]|nr:damage-inducible protein CinA [Deltaproteobacteria bacterium]